ncbi:sepiapterin reductase [Patella vulgata]|uniref:sepiapterin reductase n=1 Tax=Patella vulgata TaxID=6465 RepID=UPI002180085B|nr:sepiapterin reductase [Patella vulgata]
MSLLHKRTFCVVTGASRGIGKSIALNIAPNLGTNSVLVLLARNTTALAEVKQMLLSNSDKTAHTIQVIYRGFDQGCPDQQIFELLFSSILSEASVAASDFEQTIIFHNAGTLDNLKYCPQLDSFAKNSEYFNVNVAGLIALNAKFLSTFDIQPKVVINISSLAAKKPYKSWSLYCTVKAGREMFFKVLAAEDPSIRVLNYSPGPVDTDMLTYARNETPDKDVKEAFLAMNSDQKMLSADTTVLKLLELLEKNTFENGSHIDYFDVL